MKALCDFFPGADTPINFDDLEEEDDSLEDKYVMYDTQESFDTDMQSDQSNPLHYTDDAASNQIYRSTGQSSPRPRSFVETQVNKLQNLMAADVQPKSPKEDDSHRVRIPQQIKKLDQNEAGTSITINRTSSSPINSDRNVTSEGSTPQDILRVYRSPNIFSESSSPRGISPIVNYNIGNMNPRHIDIEQYWNRENEKLSPSRTPSALSNTNSIKKEDYNQNYCDGLNATNSPMNQISEFNGNSPRMTLDPRYQTPLQIEVDPVSSFRINS